MKWLKRLFCRHRNLVFVRDIYGDEINAAGGKRSWWICADCGRMKLRERLGNHYQQSKRGWMGARNQFDPGD